MAFAARHAVALVALAASAPALAGCAGADGTAPAPVGRGASSPGAPLSFERNVGQSDARVRFVARSAGGAVLLTRDDAVLVPARPRAAPRARGGDALRIALAGAARAPSVSGRERLPGSANYLVGASRSGWHTRVPTYAQVVYRSVYAGIDLRYHGARGELEYDFDVAPGADPGRIAIDLRGARGLRIDAAGDLHVALATSTIVHRRPRVYELRDGARRSVAGRYVLLGGRRVGFALGPYDRSRPIVIDPTIVYATPLAGSAPGAGRAIAVDRAGNTYITGETSSANLPTAHPLQARRRSANASAFVTKLDPAGDIVYSTYLGGTRFTSGHGIAVDGSGHAFVTGATSSTNFPSTRGALQRSYGGGPYDAFVTKLNRSGRALAYSTLLGDTHYDEGNAIAVDAFGRAVVAGRTVSPQFPVAGALMPHAAGGAFVVKLDHAGHRLISSTVLGGDGPANHGNTAFGVAVDRAGATYATGVTNAADFRTVDALQPALGGRADAFVVKIDPAARRVVYSTFLGGSADEVGRAITADRDGNAYVGGLTTSRDLPTAGASQAANASAAPSGSDAFVAKIEPDGGALAYSTYLGGSGDDGATGIALDGRRNVYVTGLTASPDYPLLAPLQPALRGARDAFVTVLSHPGTVLRSSTYLGGGGEDGGLAIAVDGARVIHVTGQTNSADFPRRGFGRLGPPRYAGAGDGAFVTSLGPLTSGLLAALNRRPLPARGGLPRIAALLAHGAVDVPFAAPRAGTVSIAWHTARRPRFRALVATGRARFAAPGRRLVRVRLTALGRRLLARRGRVVLTVGTAFTAADQLPVRVSRRVALRR